MQRITSLFRLGSSISHFAPAILQQQPKFITNLSITRLYSSSGFVFDIDTVEDFTEKVVNAETPVIVDFHAEWCGPCQVLGPRLEEKINGRQGQIVLAKINVDYAGELATDYNITAVPTVLAFKNGEKISGFTGVLDDEQLDDFIDDAIAA